MEKYIPFAYGICHVRMYILLSMYYSMYVQYVCMYVCMYVYKGRLTASLKFEKILNSENVIDYMHTYMYLAYNKSNYRHPKMHNLSEICTVCTTYIQTSY